MMFLLGALFFAALLWSQTSVSGAGKVLVYPMEGSHWLNMDIILQELHQRGHELTVIRSSSSWYIPEQASHYKSITVHLPWSSEIEEAESMADFLKRTLDLRRRKGPILSFIAIQQEINKLLVGCHTASAEMVRMILTDEPLVKKLRDAKYDLILIDPAFGGGVVLGSFLGLPMVFNARWATSTEAHFAIAPSPLSYVPMFGSILTDRMTFAERLINILHHVVGMHIHHFITSPPYDSIIAEFIGPDANIMSLVQSADLWLMRVDFVFEFPRATMPNVVYIGGFQCKPSKPLPAELELFVQSSGEHGVVVMSLGTLLGSLGPEISETFASAFARLPQKVVWRHTGSKPSTLGNNTLILDWLPQNDLLGHPKTKAFVTHGGTNGIYEAIYHGVPILGIPLIFDQLDNVLRLTARGIAKVVDVSALDVDTLTQALKDLLDDEQPYGENMHRASGLHRDTPLKSLDSAVFWLEFVMRHKGAAHLRTESYRMPWYIYHSVDVYALLIAVFVAGLLIFCLIGRFFYKLLIRNRKIKQQ